MNQRLLLLAMFITHTLEIYCQGVYVPVHNRDYTNLVDRIDIAQPLSYKHIHTSVKGYDRKHLAQLLDSIVAMDSTKLSKSDKFNAQYLADDNSEWCKNASANKKGLFNTFFTNKSDFYHVSVPDFKLHLNPVLHLSYGKDNLVQSPQYINSRGIELRGVISNKLGFYTFLADNQARVPFYVRNYANFAQVPGVPGEGYTKNFKQDAFDFFTARGYISFSPIKHIDIQFGHDRHFVGNGYRSLILSDFSSNYTFLKINTKVWRFNYTNLYAQLVGDVFYRNEKLPKKFLAFHHLSLNLTKNINIGMFESVVFGRADGNGSNTFDINYLNPIIFYRSAEIQMGSQDNALLGADFKINFLRRFSLYGQAVLDEFVLKQFKNNRGYYGNKYALQLGLKYINVFGIKNLDAQLEYNMARPHTYSHKNIYQNYAHYRMPLAHPMGANFNEILGIVRYQPIPRLTATAKLFLIKYGSDTSYNSTSGTDNWGSNVMKSYEAASAVRPNTNFTGQGIENNIILASLNFSFMLRHNLFIDFSQVFRMQQVSIASRTNNSIITSIGLRWNIPQRLHEF